MLGDLPAPMALRERVQEILRQHPEARNDDRELAYWYWVTFQGLSELLTADALEDFHTWFAKRAEQPETLARRRREIQNDAGKLKPSAPIEKYRRARAKFGPPRR